MSKKKRLPRGVEETDDLDRILEAFMSLSDAEMEERLARIDAELADEDIWADADDVTDEDGERPRRKPRAKTDDDEAHKETEGEEECD